jgi:exopolyphosphatase/guanosine-5'-triphosphate,3'-diphosphate pyrophosphatase
MIITQEKFSKTINKAVNPMKVGLIDCGANSIRLVVYQVKGDNLIRILNLKHHAQSALYVVDHKMTQEGIELIVTVLDEMIETVKTMNLDYFKIFATDSVRSIDNTKEAVAAIESMIHYPVEVLSDQEETGYGFLGVKKKGNLPKEGLLIDIGGACLELTFFKNEEAIETHVLPIGSLTFYHNHVYELIPNESEQHQMRLDIQSKYESIPWLKEKNIKEIIAIGGSARALLRLSREMHHMPISETSSTLYQEDVHNLSLLDIKASKMILKAAPNRLITIVPAAIMLDELMQLVDAKEVHVSDYGVREGYLFNRILATIKQ